MLSQDCLKSRRGFTLLEVILATMIVGLLSATLYRFLNAHLTAMSVETGIEDEQAELQSVVQLLRTQLNGLDPQEKEALLGRPNKFQGVPNDEITLKCAAGAPLMTATADGEFRITLTVQPTDEKSSETELGLRRSPVNPEEKNQVPLDRGGGDHKYNWLPLIRPMAGLEIRYFDPVLGAWQDAWTSEDRNPSLIRIRLWKRPGDEPLEAVLPVPSANTQR